MLDVEECHRLSARCMARMSSLRREKRFVVAGSHFRFGLGANLLSLQLIRVV